MSSELQNAEGRALGSGLLPGPLRRLDRELGERLRKTPLQLNQYGFDAYGFHPDTARRMLLPSALLYRHYFRVESHSIENVPSGHVLLISNHSGQFAYDGSMLAMAMLLEAEPPRLCRGMPSSSSGRRPGSGSLRTAWA